MKFKQIMPAPEKLIVVCNEFVEDETYMETAIHKVIAFGITEYSNANVIVPLVLNNNCELIQPENIVNWHFCELGD